MVKIPIDGLIKAAEMRERFAALTLLAYLRDILNGNTKLSSSDEKQVREYFVTHIGEFIDGADNSKTDDALKDLLAQSLNFSRKKGRNSNPSRDYNIARDIWFIRNDPSKKRTLDEAIDEFCKQSQNKDFNLSTDSLKSIFYKFKKVIENDL